MSLFLLNLDEDKPWLKPHSSSYTLRKQSEGPTGPFEDKGFLWVKEDATTQSTALMFKDSRGIDHVVSSELVSGIVGYTTIANTVIGVEAGNSNLGIDNVILGYKAGLDSTGGSNVFIGVESGKGLTTGTNNVYLDSQAVTPDETATVRLGNISKHQTTFLCGNPIKHMNNAVQSGTTVLASAVKDGVFLATGNLTLCTGTDLDEAIPGLANNDRIDCKIANSGATLRTISGATGTTMISGAELPASTSRVLSFIKTGSGTYNVY